MTASKHHRLNYFLYSENSQGRTLIDFVWIRYSPVSQSTVTRKGMVLTELAACTRTTQLEWGRGVCMHAMSLQSSSTLCDPIDYSLPGSSVHGIFQARILEWVAISFSRGSSQSRDQPHVSCVSCIAGGLFIALATGEAPLV